MLPLNSTRAIKICYNITEFHLIYRASLTRVLFIDRNSKLWIITWCFSLRGTAILQFSLEYILQRVCDQQGMTSGNKMMHQYLSTKKITIERESLTYGPKSSTIICIHIKLQMHFFTLISTQLWFCL